jgi:murein DD-endopeptidase MepM/ murein hydrolase activator NlpD
LPIARQRRKVHEHLQQGSVRVKPGDRVARGQAVARVGSSGSVSSGPHLQFHVADAYSTLGAEGVPFVFRRFRERGAFASIDAFVKGEVYLASAADGLRTMERPGPNAVVDFAEKVKTRWKRRGRARRSGSLAGSGGCVALISLPRRLHRRRRRLPRRRMRPTNRRGRNPIRRRR